MKVKWVKSGVGIGFGYLEGTETTLSESQANELLELGYVVILNKELKTGLPEMLPGRKILIENGFTTIDEVSKLSADELTTIKGIGKKLAENIVKFLNQ